MYAKEVNNQAPQSADELKAKLNPATNPYGATGWNYWWDQEVPNNPTYQAWFWENIVTSDNAVYSMLWDKAVPELWSNQYYYNYFFTTAVPTGMAISYSFSFSASSSFR
ncbi:hypothetical protein COS74_04955 [bacterium CG06_land_8_20_14_3_00_33_50]|nr:MAG: hypothetical protein COU50_02705 [bacterium CG10_big_fil_rev_8_21_14_0_10_33_18]PIU76271.1 MAG: hypothetical protein COS74_04955 [bacterium CG06_land_8_20_14_3_00_33_50]PIW81542.1 MAG: hypothetical protein COZ97_01260 [bacterium CG_4_8_14_3_um_filter_33_28]PJA71994.1 MAG: hypothetical protein CO152_03760 [bacterium CG_4_9_14_3_um_filter_33_26]